jgi:hypothetical protein
MPTFWRSAVAPPDDQNSSRKIPRPDMTSTISVQTTGLLSHCNTIATPLGIKLRSGKPPHIGKTVSA